MVGTFLTLPKCTKKPLAKGKLGLYIGTPKALHTIYPKFILRIGANADKT